jgi:hypothetical protein
LTESFHTYLAFKFSDNFYDIEYSDFINLKKLKSKGLLF